MPKRYQPNDKLAQRAKAAGYRARSVFKLEELDQKFKLIKPGKIIVDVGAAPGSWLQYCSRKVGGRSTIIGLDRNPIDPIDDVLTFEVNLLDDDAGEQIRSGLGLETIDVLISDLAPDTSGIKDVDQWRSIELNNMVLAVADDFLVPGGWCVIKVLRGSDFDEWYRDELKPRFKKLKVVVAKASRDRSREVYVVGRV